MSHMVDVKNLIVGAGAMGSATAYHLAKRGQPVMLLEQFGLGHDRGSSHGAARITRHSYADPIYAQLMVQAFRAWRDLEADACQPLYLKTGGVSFCPQGVDYVARVAANLAEVGVAHRHLSGSEFSRLLPQFQLPTGFDAVYEPDAGMITAAKAVATQQEMARLRGAILRDHCLVLRIEPDGDRTRVVTADTTYRAERLIVTAGAWTASLRPALAHRLTPTRQRVVYYEPADPEPWRIGRLPVFISMGADAEDAYYGMPGVFGTGVKVGQHAGPPVDPDHVDRDVEPEYLDRVGRFVTSYLPGLATSPIQRTEVCLYTMTPSEDFLVDFDRELPQLIVASPCSGHGFKFSCLIGEILADLATIGSTSIDISKWRN